MNLELFHTRRTAFAVSVVRAGTASTGAMT